MRYRRIGALLALLAALLAGCTPEGGGTPEPAETGQIYLYGEQHGVAAICEKELELWQGYYAGGMRHLFVEYPYYTAEFLNLWMAAEDDALLEEVFADWAGTLAHSPAVKEFLQEIKRQCPETVFHGTDVGHQYGSTGARYLAYLEETGQADTQQYRLAQEAVSQGERYYQDCSGEYREAAMTENFIRSLEALDGADIMGIYGAAHIAAEDPDAMAGQLRERYGAALHTEDLSALAAEGEPAQAIPVAGKTYPAVYFGSWDISAIQDTYVSREFWRLEGAGAEAADWPQVNNMLPYDNYPTPVETGDVFAVDYTRADGGVVRMYYYADGSFTREGRPKTVQVAPPEDTLVVNGTEYRAAYLGEQDLSAFSDLYQSRKFWMVAGCYEDVREAPKTGQWLPYDNYPAAVEEGQVFVLDYTQRDGTVVRMYFRSDGEAREGKPVTEEFVLP